MLSEYHFSHTFCVFHAVQFARKNCQTEIFQTNATFFYRSQYSLQTLGLYWVQLLKHYYQVYTRKRKLHEYRLNSNRYIIQNKYQKRTLLRNSSLLNCNFGNGQYGQKPGYAKSKSVTKTGIQKFTFKENPTKITTALLNIFISA